MFMKMGANIRNDEETEVRRRESGDRKEMSGEE
jgi:hypothetical protein